MQMNIGEGQKNYWDNNQKPPEGFFIQPLAFLKPLFQGFRPYHSLHVHQQFHDTFLFIPRDLFPRIRVLEHLYHRFRLHSPFYSSTHSLHFYRFLTVPLYAKTLSHREVYIFE